MAEFSIPVTFKTEGSLAALERAEDSLKRLAVKVRLKALYASRPWTKAAIPSLLCDLVAEQLEAEADAEERNRRLAEREPPGPSTNLQAPRRSRQVRSSRARAYRRGLDRAAAKTNADPTKLVDANTREALAEEQARVKREAKESGALESFKRTRK